MKNSSGVVSGGRFVMSVIQSSLLQIERAIVIGGTGRCQPRQWSNRVCFGTLRM